MRRLAVVGLLLASIGVGGAAPGAEPKAVPGRWSSLVDSPHFRLGLLEQTGDLHYYFFYAVCSTWPSGEPNKTIPVANITMEPSHQLVSEAIASNSYLVVRLEGDRESYELWAKSIHLNEGPSFSFWSPEFMALEPEKLVPILLGEKVLLHFGLRTGDGKVSLREAYRLPDENRINAVDFFASACFPDWEKRVRR